MRMSAFLLFNILFERVEVRSERWESNFKWVPILVAFHKIGRFLGDFSIFEE